MRFLRFALVGVGNTAIGVSVIAAGTFFGMNPILANALGYCVGLCVSFVLNARFTFRERGEPGAAIRYLAAFLVAYGVNLATVFALRPLLSGHPVINNLVGIVPYTLVFFVLADQFAFRKRHAYAADAHQTGDN